MSINSNEGNPPYKDGKKPFLESVKKWFLVLILVSTAHLIGIYAIDSLYLLTGSQDTRPNQFKNTISVQLNYAQEVASEIPTPSNTDQASIEASKAVGNQKENKQTQDSQRLSKADTSDSRIEKNQTAEKSPSPQQTTIVSDVAKKQHNDSAKTSKTQPPEFPTIRTIKSNNEAVSIDLKNYTEIEQPMSLANSFEIVQESLPTLQQKNDDMFKNVFSQEYKTALQEAIQEQKQYLKGFIKNKGYQITKDSDGTRYVNIKGICWKMPPEGESGEWFIVPAGCNNQKESFHFEFGITPEMLSPNSPFSRLLGLEFDPNQ
ncbi:hypothetical protein [Marinomonas algicola]|uniref:hypothetical protein n=1 Tax=Marinomonas algicola TaxID=2773454 RepID=UPI00174B4B6E|nr:hypothetical protein [Marinomonas algicola]